MTTGLEADFWPKALGRLRQPFRDRVISAVADPSFVPGSLAVWADEALAGFPESNDAASDVFLETCAVQLLVLLETNAKKQPIVAGVLKKGMSILLELKNRTPRLSRVSTQTEEQLLARDDLAGAYIILVDDTIHRGNTLADLILALSAKGVKQIDVVALLSNAAGISNLRQRTAEVKTQVSVFTQITIPDENLFSFLFARYVVPALDLCTEGAIVNRKRLQIIVAHRQLSLQQQAARTLELLCETGIVASIHQLPSASARLPSRVFHGTGFYSTSFSTELEKEFGPADQEKLRLFINPAESLTISLAPIRFVPETIESNELVRSMADFVIKRLSTELRPRLVGDGFEILREEVC